MHLVGLRSISNAFLPSCFSTVYHQATGRTKKEAQHRAAVEALKELRKMQGLLWPALTIPPPPQYLSEGFF